MTSKKIEIGKQYTYFPPAQHVDDNIHYPATVESIGKRIKIKIFSAEFPEGKNRYVSAKRLVEQIELIP